MQSYMKNINLKDLITDELDDSPEQMGHIRVKIRRAIVEKKIENYRGTITFDYLDEAENKYYKLVNILADSILSEWDE